MVKSAFRDCCASRSRTGVEACSLLAAIAPDAFTAVLLVVLFTLGMPRFSARLLAIEDCGSRRRDVGGAGEDVDEDEVRFVETLGEGDVTEASPAWLMEELFLSFLRGASLIRPASLRWWSSRRVRMRRACACVRLCSIIEKKKKERERERERERAHLGVVCVLGGIVKCGRREIMFVPRSRDALLEGCCCRGADVFMGFGEVCRLHGVVAGEGWTCSWSCVFSRPR